MASIYNQIAKISILTLCLLYSCNTETLQSQKLDVPLKNVQTQDNISQEIKGHTELSDFNSPFRIKSEPDFSTRATVSVIYPSDYPNAQLREATIATGLTDSKGDFIINAGFTPEYNQVMILESSKRNKGIGYPSVSLRTHIRWNGQKWESISGDNILVNKKTTTIAIISSLETNVLTSNETINRIAYNGTVSTVSYNSKFTEAIYKKYLSNVSLRLSSSIDPVKFYADPYFLSAEIRAKLASVKSNMHTFQTMVETYAVDWGGNYPDTAEALIQEATNKWYIKNYRNPFGTLTGLPIAINSSDYITAKNTLKYKGQDIDDISSIRGTVVYDPQPINSVITKYFIYGVDITGDYIQDKGQDFTLTNQ